MISTILKIIPRIDNAKAKQMETSLSKRFQRASSSLSKGFKGLLAGNVLGIALSQIVKLLNPLKEIEERMNRILGIGQDANDLASRFNTSPGEIFRLQQIGKSAGLSSEDLTTLLTQFSDAVKEARRQGAAGEELSPASRSVSQFVGIENQAEAFAEFIQSLRAADPALRSRVEQNVFGAEQFGASQRFINTDFAQRFAEIGGPNAQALNTRFDKLAKLAQQQRVASVRNETIDLTQSADRIDSDLLAQIERRNASVEQNQRDQLLRADSIVEASNNLQFLVQLGTRATEDATKILGQVSRLVQWADSIRNSWFFKNPKKARED